MDIFKNDDTKDSEYDVNLEKISDSLPQVSYMDNDSIDELDQFV